MLEFPTVWIENNADSLLDLSIKYCIQNPRTFCTYVGSCSEYKLREDLSLPEEICERMLYLCKNEMDKECCSRLIKLFQDPSRTRLRRVNLSHSSLDDNGLEIVTRHQIVDLNIASCPNLTEQSLVLINKIKDSLQSLVLGNSIQLFPNEWKGSQYQDIFNNVGFFVPEKWVVPKPTVSHRPIFEFLGLRKLVIEGLNKHWGFLDPVLQGMKYLSYLDLSKCQDIGNLSILKSKDYLVSLVLYNVNNIESCLPTICELKSLRRLDISHSDGTDRFVHFTNPNKTLKLIVESLESLEYLDISGTNLAGKRAQERDDSPSESSSDKIEDETVLTDIPGLKSRVNRPLEFLGLLNAAHEACYRHHIPAKKISGDANEEQILISAQVYCAREEIIQKVLNDLFHIFRFSTCTNTRLALDVVMEAMKLHLKDKHIQISGSASLFYIVKGEDKDHFNIKIKRRIIRALLDAMFEHSGDVTMVRNGCLTLIHFKIPEDVIFEYERLVTLLLVIVSQEGQDDFVQRIGVYLLNSLACQVDGFQKQLVGDRGAISIMLQIIENRLNRHLCDEVMETAWSTMWNVTDETPVNCARFLEGKGMDLFLGCLQAFPQRPELLRNMMGLLGNVAEVKDLRHSLMKDEYLSVFSELLSSKSDGIEVSYNAAGILSHIASDGPELWALHNISSVKRKEVLKQMVEAIEKWNLNTKRNINYRSFEPILRLLSIEHTPEAQHWAVWALANLTKVYPEKYCSLLGEEGGIEILHMLLKKPGNSRIFELADAIIKTCQEYENGEISEPPIEDDSDVIIFM